jgi:hypothetical protein
MHCVPSMRRTQGNWRSLRNGVYSKFAIFCSCTMYFYIFSFLWLELCVIIVEKGQRVSQAYLIVYLSSALADLYTSISWICKRLEICPSVVKERWHMFENVMMKVEVGEWWQLCLLRERR